MKTLHINCLPFIYKMKQASKANKRVSECSKTRLCITVKVRCIVIGLFVHLSVSLSVGYAHNVNSSGTMIAYGV